MTMEPNKNDLRETEELMRKLFGPPSATQQIADMLRNFLNWIIIGMALKIGFTIMGG